MEPRLYYFESSGRAPSVGTLAHRLWLASTAEDETLWEQLGMNELREDELIDAVNHLRGLGWDFYYGALQ